MRDNLAYPPTGGDREGVKNILAGTCDLSITSVSPSELTLSWGELKPVSTPLVEVAAHRAEAAALVDELKFNEGAQN